MASAKIFLLLLALVPIVVGDNDTEGACFGQANYDRLMGKVSEYRTQLNTTNLEHLLPPWDASRFSLYCGEIKNMSACIKARYTPNPEEAQEMAAYQAFLKSLSDIFCATDVQQKYACLLSVSSRPAPAGCQECTNFKQSLRDTYRGHAEHGTLTSATLKGACQYLNCWTRCRKTLLTTTCQQSGYDALKKLWTLVGQFLPQFIQRLLHDTIQGAFPNECQANGLIKDL